MNADPPLPATEAADPRYQELDAWQPAVVLEALLEAQFAAVAAVRAALPAIEAAAGAAVPALQRGGRLIYAGAGTSGRIAAQDGAELPPTFNWPRDRLVVLMAGGPNALTAAAEGAEDDAGAGRQAIADTAAGANDVVLGIAASGGTPFTCAVLEAANARGAVSIGVANTQAARLLTLAAFPILVQTGAEPLAGSTRLKAGTAQKVILNLFSTLVMLRLGHVHRGLMVDMQASNTKLRARALRMLQQLTGADGTAAQAALDAAGWRIKPAVLVLRGLDAGQAADLLARNGGRLRAALAEIDR